jgi:hypothetical protein
VKRIGLHWLLSFMPAIVLSVALALERRALVVTVRWFAGLAVLHAAVIFVLLSLPLETWKDTRFYTRLVVAFDPASVLRPLAPLLDGAVLANDGYSTAALLSFHTKRNVPVFGPGSVYGRHDDIVTDWRTYQGRDFVILRRNEPAPAEYRPYFRSLEVRRVEARGAAYYTVLGRGFDYAAYREGVLRPVRERWYRIPPALPVGHCYFFERYGLQ